MNRWLIVTSHVYQCVVFAYPNDFRRRYAAEMASVFEESWEDAYRKRGTALAGLCLATAYDLMVSVFAAHVSRFFSNFKSDFEFISKSPVFAAAFGAVAGNLFFIQEVVFGPPFGLRKTVQERLVLLGMASTNIAVLWLASACIFQFVVHTSNKARLLLLKDRLHAFRRLAGISVLLAMVATAKLLITGDVSLKYATDAAPAIGYWVGFPVLLLTVLLIIFLLQPVLTLRSS